jgi:phosphoribosylformylglycinamidine synthase
MIRAQVIVRPRASIFDPQGDAVGRAIQHLGVSLKQAHVGKFIELEIEGDDLKAAKAQLETICKDLLSNPVIEDYTLTLEGGSVSDRIANSAAKLNKGAKKD